MSCSEIYSSGRKDENPFLIFPLALADGAWDAVSVFFLRLLCLVALLSWRPGIFLAPFRPLRLARQASTPLPLGSRHLGAAPLPGLPCGSRSLPFPSSMVPRARLRVLLRLCGASLRSPWYCALASLGLTQLGGDGGRGGPEL